MGLQFTLRALLVAVAIVAGYCALLARWPLLFGLLTIPIGLLGLAYCAKKAGAKVDGWSVVTLIVIGVVLVALLLPATQMARSGPRHPCLNNLHRVGIALGNYHARHLCYPPPYVADAQGRPLVSWRVLLLPYLERKDLYDQWKKHSDEPWNGPHNSKLSKTVLELFHCPSDTGPPTETSYVAVVGHDTIWPGTGKVNDSKITDGLSNTLILVEVANSGINWMEPRDLDFGNRSPGINPSSGLGVSSSHPGFVCVTFADGRSTTLEQTITEEQLQALLTIAGGEQMVLP